MLAPGEPTYFLDEDVDGWAVTRDLRMRKRAAEIDAIRTAGAIHIVLRGGPLGSAGMAAALIAAHPRLSAHLPRRYPPMIAHVHPDGRVDMVLDGERRGARRR